MTIDIVKPTSVSDIRVKPSPSLREVIPGIVWSCRPFKFRPKTFYLDHPQLNKTKFFDKDLQVKSLENWKNGICSGIYVCTSSPDDLIAKYFAAYLVSLFPKRSVVWEELNSVYEKPVEFLTYPSLIVISGLCVDSSKIRLEKARDIINKYYNIPRIVVAGGADPITFASVYLRTPVNSIFYYCDSTVANTSEVL